MNNKTAIILFALLLFSLSLSAQRKYYEPEYYVGATGGVTGSMVYFYPQIEQTYLLGMTEGLIFRYIGDKYFGVQAELNHRQRGWQEPENLYARRLDYLELPFMTHFYMGKKTRVHFNLGLEGSFLIGEKVLINNTENSDAAQHNLPVKNKFNYGFCGGPGFSIKIAKQVIQLDIRASYSIGNIFANAPKDRFDSSNNLTAAITLAWLVQLKK
jgi:hypothetical protein